MSDFCKSCKYCYRSYPTAPGMCVYCAETGKLRGCAAGEGCTRYTPRNEDEAPKTVKMPVLYKDDSDDFADLVKYKKVVTVDG